MSIGYEELTQEMMKRGATRAQGFSASVAMAMDIISGEDIHEYLRNAKKQLEHTKKKIEDEVWRANAEREKVERLVRIWEDTRDEVMSFESAKARDAYRLALAFKEATVIDTKYDNTAYINGLARILAPNLSEEYELEREEEDD